MVANMVGYSVGISGTGSIASSITWGNALVAMYVVSCLFLGVLFMQEWREEEQTCHGNSHALQSGDETGPSRCMDWMDRT